MKKIIILLLVLLITPFSVRAESSTETNYKDQVIKIGLPYQSVDLYHDENKSGIEFDHLKKLEEKLELTFEVTIFDGYVYAKNGLLKGEVDLLLHVPFLEEQGYLVMDNFYMPNYYSYMTNIEYLTPPFSSMESTYGVLNGLETKKSINESIPLNKNTYLDYSIERGINALLNNSIDAFVVPTFLGNDLINRNEELKLSPINNIIYFQPLTIGYVDPKFDALINEFSKLYDNGLRKELSQQAKNILNDNQVSFFQHSLTVEELKYLNSIDEIRVGLDEFAPIVFKLEESNEFIGSGIEILKGFSNLFNLEIVFVEENINNWNQSLTDVENGTIDLLMPATLTEERLNTLNVAGPFYSDRFAIVGTVNQVYDDLDLYDVKDYKLGMVEGWIYIDILSEILKLNESDFTLYPSIYELFDALEKEEIDFSILSDTMLTYYKTFEGYEYITPVVLLPNSYSDDLGFMFSETYDGEMLSSIMTKYLTYTDVSTIVSKWRHSTVNVESFELLKLRSERSALMLYVLIVTSVVIIGAIFYQYLIKKQNIDDLTRTFNRKALMKQRFNHSILFSLIDIDNFKSINDVFGPKVGDEVLIAFSARLQKRFGKSNVYRIGGDDFVAIVPVDSKSDIESIELFNVIQKELIEPLNVNGRQIILQCSLGIASSVISKVNTPEKLLIEADNALMIAKEKGANTTLYLSEDIHQKLQYEQFLQNEFKYAFAYDEITPFYQPLIDLKNNKVIGYEALARWIYQYDTIFTPHTFLPYAKRLAIIDQLDFLVLRKALSTFNEMRDENLVENDFLVSVNFSHATLTLLDILDITRLADSYNVEYGNIEIEILEDVILDSLIKDKIKKLHQLGFKISLDDFSAGHSSLKSFVEYDLNILKIDRMLIPNLHSDSVEFSIYKTIVDLANHANIKVIAEGIETVDQLEYLKDLNVDYGQGYYYSKPMPKEDFKNYIENYDELQH